MEYVPPAVTVEGYGIPPLRISTPVLKGLTKS